MEIYNQAVPRHLQGLVLIMVMTSVFCFMFLQQSSNYNYRMPPVLGFTEFKDENNLFIWEPDGGTDSDSKLIAELVEEQTKIIDDEMASYQFHSKLADIKSHVQLQPKRGGTPIRNMVVTTWRSGSTFLGDLMQSHPASFYHYEPLLSYGIKRIREGGPLRALALTDLEKFMRCNYSDMEHFTIYSRTHPFQLSHNERVWKSCHKGSKPDICFSPDYLAAMCEIFPFQNIKTVRLETSLVENFLKDPSLNLKVLLLVRDPRATLQSRHHRDWCPGEPDCDDPRSLCRDLLSDFESYTKFSKLYPESFKVVRYEDMSFNIYNISKEVFDFFRLTYNKDVQVFLESHTKVKIGGVSSTYRDSKRAPVHWRADLPWSEVQDIQKHCLKALRVWGYELAYNASHLLSFDPVGTFEYPKAVS